MIYPLNRVIFHSYVGLLEGRIQLWPRENLTIGDFLGMASL
jgi:hypothetical protein